MRRGVLVLACLALAPGARAGDIADDERVVFFPTAAALEEGRWLVPVHGWIFEPEKDSFWRSEVAEAFAEHLGVEPDTPEGRRCAARAAAFLVDNERGKEVRIRIAGRTERLPASEPDGHFRATIALPRAAVEAHADHGTLRFEAAADDGRRFAGAARLVPPEGVSVISDLDDTVKVSHVRDREALLRHTFALPYEAVPGMAEAYAAWAERGAAFHYVSASPWQLYEPLAELLEARGFPAGSFHLKSVRLKDETLLDLFAPATETKPPVIDAILARWPRRRFVLVGDAGEQDPEIYGGIARKHPGRVVHVFIRRVEGADHGEARFAKAFADIEPARWTLFSDGTELAPDAVVDR